MRVAVCPCTWLSVREAVRACASGTNINARVRGLQMSITSIKVKTVTVTEIPVDQQLLCALDELGHIGRDLAKLVEEKEWRDVPLCPRSSVPDGTVQTKITSYFVETKQ